MRAIPKNGDFRFGGCGAADRPDLSGAAGQGRARRPAWGAYSARNGRRGGASRPGRNPQNGTGACVRKPLSMLRNEKQTDDNGRLRATNREGRRIIFNDIPVYCYSFFN